MSNEEYDHLIFCTVWGGLALFWVGVAVLIGRVISG
jgi:hypothetical protein